MSAGKQDVAFLPRLFQGIQQISMDAVWIYIPLIENQSSSVYHESAGQI
jgi:hypothetical protein